MFNNERRTSDAGKTYLPFALVLSLIVRKYKQLMFAGVWSDSYGRDGPVQDKVYVQ